MYQVQGYVDMNGCTSKGRIWTYQMLCQEKPCYLWCVTLDEQSAAERMKEKDKQLELWFYQEVGGALQKGEVYIQKELNRLGAQMAGRLILYYDGRLYFCNRDKGAYWHLGREWGVYLCECTEGLRGALEGLLGAGDVSMAVACHGEARGSLDKREQMDCVGNFLERKLLKSLSAGELRGGYFWLWEA